VELVPARSRQVFQNALRNFQNRTLSPARFNEAGFGRAGGSKHVVLQQLPELSKSRQTRTRSFAKDTLMNPAF
jgi:hypothetical protein